MHVLGIVTPALHRAWSESCVNSSSPCAAQAKGGSIAPQALERKKAQYAGKNIRGKTVLG